MSINTSIKYDRIDTINTTQIFSAIQHILVFTIPLR